ncbi:hypothetical protein BD779DRAFT_1505581 [Infundibulicybe gibba]|nr:hypothetical protein BD779DRAFT_1505581 [Infundibulicybe gibba]
MCNLETEGTKHGCGHYVITKKVGKRDCRSQFCVHSICHAPECPHCPSCERYLGPDVAETVTRTTPDYCPECAYWYKGAGRQSRR